MLRKSAHPNSGFFQFCPSRQVPSDSIAAVSTRSKYMKKSLKNHQHKDEPLKRKNMTPLIDNVQMVTSIHPGKASSRPTVSFSYRHQCAKKDVASPQVIKMSQPAYVNYQYLKPIDTDISQPKNSNPSSSTSFKFGLPSQQREQLLETQQMTSSRSSASVRYTEQSVHSEEMIKRQELGRGMFGDIRETKIKQEEEMPFSPPSVEEMSVEDISPQVEQQRELIEQARSQKKSDVPSTIDNSIKASFKVQLQNSPKLISSDKTVPQAFQRGSLFSRVRNAETLCATLTEMSQDLSTSNVIDNFQGMLAKIRDKKLTGTQLEEVEEND